MHPHPADIGWLGGCRARGLEQRTGERVERVRRGCGEGAERVRRGCGEGGESVTRARGVAQAGGGRALSCACVPRSAVRRIGRWRDLRLRCSRSAVARRSTRGSPHHRESPVGGNATAAWPGMHPHHATSDMGDGNEEGNGREREGKRERRAEREKAERAKGSTATQKDARARARVRACPSWRTPCRAGERGARQHAPRSRPAAVDSWPPRQ